MPFTCHSGPVDCSCRHITFDGSATPSNRPALVRLSSLQVKLKQLECPSVSSKDLLMSNTNVLHSYIWVTILCFTFLCSFFIPVYHYFFILYIISVKVKKTIACSIRGDLQCYLQGIFSAKNSTTEKSYFYAVFLSCFSKK